MPRSVMRSTISCNVTGLPAGPAVWAKRCSIRSARVTRPSSWLLICVLVETMLMEEIPLARHATRKGSPLTASPSRLLTLDHGAQRSSDCIVATRKMGVDHVLDLLVGQFPAYSLDGPSGGVEQLDVLMQLLADGGG